MKAVPISLVLAAALAVAAPTFAQNATSNTVRWAEGAPNATSDVKEGNKIEGLKTDDIHIYVSLTDLKETEYNRVWVQISNHGKTPIDFNPQSAVLLKGDKSIRAEVPDKAAGAIQRFGEAKSQELSSAHCTMMTAVGCQPTNAQMQLSKQVLAFSGQQAQWVRDNGWKEKTLAPGDAAQAFIVFKKDKKAADYILRIPIGGQTFEFPVSAQNKIPSYD